MTQRQERTDFVNRSFDELFDYYSREPYKSQIDAMGQLGISSAVLDVVLNRETYVPMIAKKGAADMPFDDDSGHIAVVAVDPGEEVTFPVGFHPLQKSELTTPATAAATLPLGAGASTYSPVTLRQDDDVPDTYFYRRPTILLPYEKRSHEFSTVLIHELTHVAQQLMYFVRKFESTPDGLLDKMVSDYNNEFDAYQMQENVFGREFLFLMDGTVPMAQAAVRYRGTRLNSTGGYVTRENLGKLRRDQLVGRVVSYAQLDDA